MTRRAPSAHPFGLRTVRCPPKRLRRPLSRIATNSSTTCSRDLEPCGAPAPCAACGVVMFQIHAVGEAFRTGSVSDEESPVSGRLLTISVAAYNEADNLAFVIGHARECVKLMPGSAEILIVDDGSTDGTGAIADGLAAAYPEVRVFHHGTNRGFGGAIASCLREAMGQWVFLGPADGQIDLAVACEFFRNRGTADIVLGVRETRSDSIYRKLLSLGFHTVAKTLLGLPYKEFSSCLLIRREPVAKFEILSRPDAATILPEMLFRAHRSGMRVIDRPVAHYPRRSGQAKGADPRVIAKSLFGLIRLAWVLRRGR